MSVEGIKLLEEGRWRGGGACSLLGLSMTSHVGNRANEASRAKPNLPGLTQNEHTHFT